VTRETEEIANNRHSIALSGAMGLSQWRLRPPLTTQYPHLKMSNFSRVITLNYTVSPKMHKFETV